MSVGKQGSVPKCLFKLIFVSLNLIKPSSLQNESHLCCLAPWDIFMVLKLEISFKWYDFEQFEDLLSSKVVYKIFAK
jgi:hypothetical protein